jgi:hypothetical protein
MSATPFPTSVPLGESIRDLALSLMNPTNPTSDRFWRAHVRGLLDPVRVAFAQHRLATEGARGLYAEVVHDAPRLAHTVDGLVAEHHALDSAMDTLTRWADELSQDAETLRRRALEVLGDLSRHRQHDADLVYEAYTTDIGGE